MKCTIKAKKKSTDGINISLECEFHCIYIAVIVMHSMRITTVEFLFYSNNMALKKWEKSLWFPCASQMLSNPEPNFANWWFQSNNKNANAFGATKMKLLVYHYFAEMRMAIQLFFNKKQRPQWRRCWHFESTHANWTEEKILAYIKYTCLYG